MIFEPTVLKVIRLVKEQIIASNVPVRKVMLVGGFGQSTYLRERIYTAVNAESQQPIELMQPEMAWQAVVRGAVLKGLALHSPKEVAHIRIESRVARKHYGTEVGDAYSDDLHAFIKDQRWFDGFSGIWRVNIINWFIQRVSRPELQGERCQDHKFACTDPCRVSLSRSKSLSTSKCR